MVEEKKSFALMMAIDVDDVHKLEHTTHTPDHSLKPNLFYSALYVSFNFI